MTLKMFLIAFSAVMLCGCISKRSGGASFRSSNWTVGATTRRDVVKSWGNPDRIQGNVWIWREKRHLGGKIKASYYGVGITVSKVNIADYEHRLEFNAFGRLTKKETVCSVPSGEKWSVNPF